MSYTEIGGLPTYVPPKWTRCIPPPLRKHLISWWLNRFGRYRYADDPWPGDEHARA